VNRSTPIVAKSRILRIRNKELVFGLRTYVMGIVNVTPDSFSQDGIVDSQAAISYALKQIQKGADIIDIGGQSARPGHQPIDEETEIKRILPVIAGLRKVSDVIISIDTFSAVVLEQAIAAGADILNSIWGLTDELLQIVKRNPIPIVIMHNRGNLPNPPLQNMKESVGVDAIDPGNGMIAEVVDYLADAANKAMAAGLAREQIILDPGIGFGKTADQNIEILSQFNKITALGFPTLIGSSRKSTIGKLTDRPVDQRVFGTAATVAFAIAQLVDIVRVHDVEEIVDVIKVSDALVRNWRPDNWTNQ